MRTLILGLGNDILTDDAVGLIAVRDLEERLKASSWVEVRETMEMGLALLDFMVDYERVVIVDSIQTGTADPGTIHEVDARGFSAMAGRTPHFLGVGETLALGDQLGLRMPRQVVVLAVEVEDPFTLGTEMTQRVSESVPRLVQRVVSLVRDETLWPATETASDGRPMLAGAPDGSDG